ncbi:DUF378 domain-containing protein [Alsobacter sp. R-9]
MKAINVIAMILLIVGGLNWGLVGLLDVDAVAAIFGEGTGLARAVYCLVGLAALWGLYLLKPVTRGSDAGYAVERFR